MRRARQKGLPFSLVLGDVKALLDAGWSCVYCKRPLGTYKHGARPDSATLDRILPDEGYTPENTVLCCHKCNGIKAEHTVKSLNRWINRIQVVLNGRTQRVKPS